MMAEDPLLPGAVKLTVSVPLPVAIVSPVGAPGAEPVLLPPPPVLPPALLLPPPPPPQAVTRSAEIMASKRPRTLRKDRVII
jgi:hypothetical protein